MIDLLLAADATVDASTRKSPQTALRVAIHDQELEAASALILDGASFEAASLSEERRLVTLAITIFNLAHSH